MDEFAELRGQLYRTRKNDDWENEHGRLKALAEAILGFSVPAERSRQIALAAALRSSDADDSSLVETDWENDSPYIARYLADAAGDAEPSSARPPEQRATPHRVAHPVSVVQCMFHGDPMRTGLGDSGGIATLLMQLGSAMGEAVGGVVTLVLYNRRSAAYPFVPVERVTDHHSIVRMAVELEDETALGFLKDHRQIRDAVESTLADHGISPEIVHVRYLDDASLAAARLARTNGAKVVTTVTPDPHRTLCGPDGALRRLTADEALASFHKILIGDELIRLSHGLLAIGRNTLGRELLPYFPQLEDTRRKVIDGIDEGIRIKIENPGIDVPGLLTEESGPFRLDRSTLDRPAILTVGRLAPVKQQASLVRAWSLAAWETHNLVLVGGDHVNPDPTEARVLGEVAAILEHRPELASRICFLPAQPNAAVRTIQSYFSERIHETHFDTYVCPSLKEEFGLSIIEAMASGMMVCAPIRGGARTYIRHGVNGYLVDTSNPDVLVSELNATALRTGLARAQVTAIRRNAARTAADYEEIIVE